MFFLHITVVEFAFAKWVLLGRDGQSMLTSLSTVEKRALGGVGRLLSSVRPMTQSVIRKRSMTHLDPTLVNP